MRLVLAIFFLYELAINGVFALTCAQCSGFSGWYPDKNAVNSCDNRNLNCATPNFCVKIVDPIKKSAHYLTYKSDCYYSNTIASQVNNTPITNGKCFPYMSNDNPPKQFLYCFCNDRDYCNGSERYGATFGVVLVATIVAVRSLF